MVNCGRDSRIIKNDVGAWCNMKDKWAKMKPFLLHAVRILLFMGLVIIDHKRCVGNGDEWAAANLNIWWILGVFALLHLGLRQMLRWWVALYGLLCAGIFAVIYLTLWEMPRSPYIELSIITLNFFVLGTAIGIYAMKRYDKWREFSKEKGGKIALGEIFGKVLPGFCKRNWFLVACVAFFGVMLCVPDDLHKPFMTLLVFGFLFCLSFSKEEKIALANDLIYGVMAGFWLLQGSAFAFRPYTEGYIRYRGMYYNSNMYSLLCLTIMVLTLVKLYEVRKKKGIKNICYILLLLQYCFSISCIVYSIGRITMVLAGLFTLLYLIFLLWEHRKIYWKKVCVLGGITVCSFCLVLPGTYLAIRYLPLVLTYQVEYQDEYYIRGDMFNPEDYVSAGEFSEEFFGRLAKLWMKNTKKPVTEVVTENEEGEEIVTTLLPEDPLYGTRRYYIDYQEGYNAVELRVAIWRTFLDQTNLWGHTSEEYIQYITPYKGYGHAHNIFVQMIFQYGIVAGIMFVCWMALYLMQALKHLKAHADSAYGLLPIGVWILVIGFGCVEADWFLGQIPWFLLLFTQLFMIRKEK